VLTTAIIASLRQQSPVPAPIVTTISQQSLSNNNSHNNNITVKLSNRIVLLTKYNGRCAINVAQQNSNQYSNMPATMLLNSVNEQKQ
jgi:hypothetical protein